MKISMKLSFGFGVLLIMLIITGVISYSGISYVNHDIKDIEHQLQIIQKVNRSLVDTTDAQGHSLRLMIYKDPKYLENMNKEFTNALDLAQSAKQLMKSQKNKDNTEAIENAVTSYQLHSNKWWKIENEKNIAGTKRYNAALKIKEQAKKFNEFMIKLTRLSINNQNSKVSKNLLDNIVFAQNIYEKANVFFNTANLYKLAITPEEQNEIATKWINDIDNLEEFLKTTENKISHEPSLTIIKDIMTSLKSYRNEVLAFNESNENQRNEQILQKQSAEAAIASCKKVRNGVYSYINQVVNNANTDTDEVQFIIILSSITAIILGTVLILLITRSITRPINVFAAHTLNLEKGNLSETLPERKDELGKMSCALNSLIHHMRNQADTASKIADGNLNVSVTVASDVDMLGISINKMVDNLNRIINNVRKTTEQVAVGASQTSQAAQSLEQGATSQAASLEEINASVAELSRSTEYNAQNAAQANSIADNTSKAAEEGQMKMEQMIDSMTKINNNSSETQKVIKTIDDIAFQTNLLALNAAVEAARAGTHGKGFAVVAEEVRNLAARSAKAAAETANLIESSNKEIQDGVLISKETSQALNKISENVSKTNNLVTEIATASKEQAQGISQVQTALTQIESVTQINTANSEETASASEEMSSQANMLKELVASFQLKPVNNDTSIIKNNNNNILTKADNTSSNIFPLNYDEEQEQASHSTNPDNLDTPNQLTHDTYELARI